MDQSQDAKREQQITESGLNKKRKQDRLLEKQSVNCGSHVCTISCTNGSALAYRLRSSASLLYQWENWFNLLL